MKLYWNNQGQIGCEKHIPWKMSDTWKNEQWVGIRATDILDNNLKCETCKWDAIRVNEA